MRIRRLRIAAFGPFADTVDLEVDRLNEAGLFLLTGSNGAGKSSILDAVCFALYGAVPGDRNAAKRYRSDHAVEGQAPIVELEVTFADGTYRIVRTAAWERPKRRGAGTTTQQSTVSVSRRDGDAWQPMTSRLDEAGHLVRRLVGMNLTQFCQVVILPQGRFQAFLQAKAEERQALLEQLFHTGRFKRVEQWLRERRRALTRAVVAEEQAIREVLGRVSEVAETPAPEDLPLEAATTWARHLRDDTLTRVDQTAADLSAAAVTETQARAALDAGRELAGRILRYREAASEQVALAARAPVVSAARDRSEAARRAAPVRPLVTLLHDRAGDLRAAEQGHADAVRRVADRLGACPESPESAVRELRDETVRLKSLLPRVRELDTLTSELTSARATQAATSDRIGTLAASTLDEQVASWTAARAGAVDARSELPGAELAVARLRDRLAAHESYRSLQVDLDAALTELAAARARALDAKDLWLTVREARIEGMAAELAGVLAVGCECPVCGSTDHPLPATPLLDSPDAEGERTALKRHDDAQAEVLARELLVRDLTASRDRTHQDAGPEPETDVRTQLDAATDRLATLSADAALLDEATTRLEAAEQATRAETEERQRLREECAVLCARSDDLTSRRDALSAELAQLLPGPAEDLESLIDHLEVTRALAEGLLEEELRVAHARRARDDARDSLASAALAAGFASAEDATCHLLPPDELERETERVRDHDARVAAVAATLAEPELIGLADAEPPDLDLLTAAHDAAATERARIEQERTSLARRHERLTELADRLVVKVDAWLPLRDDLDVVSHLASFCEGKAPDNRRQMQLSAYVVAWRLRQVAAAANERLASMTHARYSLEHTESRNAGERRGGLGLVVRDDWTGVSRDPVTLSGGESFVVALALALGLADVIAHEAGGAALQTLFVDEGFGSLDADHLDQVLDTLDSLRESGRAVGVVSHVPEMRSRIPVQVHVHKPDHGPSSVRVRA